MKFERITIENGLSHNAVTAVTQDSKGFMWFGTDNGLNKYDGYKINIYRNDSINKSKQKFENVQSLLTDRQGKLWIGSLSDTLTHYDNKSDDFYNLELRNGAGGKKSDVRITAIKEDSKNNLWIGTLGKGIIKFEMNTGRIKYFGKIPGNENSLASDSILCLHIDENDNIWSGTLDNGFSLFNERSMVYMNFRFSDNGDGDKRLNRINDIFKNSQGQYFISTGSGLKYFETDENKIMDFPELNSSCAPLRNDSIMKVCEDKNKNLWIATEGSGVFYYDPGKSKVENFRFCESDNYSICDDNISSIYNDRTNVTWIGTQTGGVCRVDCESKKLFPVNEDNGNKTKPGSYIPQTVITEFQIFNKPVTNSPESSILKNHITHTEELLLSHRERVFSFEFASLIFNDPLKNEYAYMMEGFDREWIYSGTRRFVTYTNLRPGNYTFRVKGSNGNGTWNEKGTSMKIKITPPFWKTWWFKSLGVMSMMSATGMAYNQKLAKIESDKKFQEEFSRRLLESQEDERKRIASDLHHTIAHDILITKNKAVIGLKKNGDEVLKNILREISDLASETLNDVRSISYNLHPHQIERLGMTKALRSIINGVSGSCEIKFSSSIENIDKVLPAELEINLFRIIQECTNNILKHSGATEASLNIIKDNKTLTISVWDNGKGISKDRINGLGLTGIEERVKLYNGVLVIQSIKEKGTVIVISLPYKKQNL